MLAGAKLEEERNTRLCEALNWVIRRKCEVHSGGQAHVGQGQLTGGAWDRAGHHQSPHYEAHCARSKSNIEEVWFSAVMEFRNTSCVNILRLV